MGNHSRITWQDRYYDGLIEYGELYDEDRQDDEKDNTYSDEFDDALWQSYEEYLINTYDDKEDI